MYRVTLAALLLATVLVASGCRTPNRAPADMQAKRPPPTRPSLPPTGGPAPPTGTITLREAAALALTHNPRLQTFSFEIQAAQARKLQAGLRPDPELEVEIESLAGRGERSGFDAAETTIQLGQLIELGGKRDKRIRAASLTEDLTRWDYESERLDVLKEVVDAFVEVLAAQERLSLAEQLGDLAREAQSAVAQRVEAGKDSPVQNLRAGVVVSQSRIEVRKAKGALATARLRLAAMWGASTATFEQTAGDFYRVETVPALHEVRDALADNPDLARWAVEQRRYRAALDLEKARARADLTVAAGVQRFSPRPSIADSYLRPQSGRRPRGDGKPRESQAGIQSDRNRDRRDVVCSGERTGQRPRRGRRSTERRAASGRAGLHHGSARLP
jgi:outer membrane protein TolC